MTALLRLDMLTWDSDDIDKRFDDAQKLPDVFTTYRKMVEPLRENAREVLHTPAKNSLPPLPPPETIPAQPLPFVIPNTHRDLEEAILFPVTHSPGIANPPPRPEPLNSAHPYHGGEKFAHERIDHLIKSGSMTSYKATRNGLLGLDFSTKLSAWLALGCITARQVHAKMYAFEEGTNPMYRDAQGWGEGENEGTKAVRFELAWRDYMRLCHKKFGDRILSVGGFKQDFSYNWKTPGPDSPEIQAKLDRFLNGTTGMGLIDASQRELYFTGYTSNRARQNVASYLSKHLGMDWRLGAEWYENLLIDYDISSNWGNWQYVAGVGNDPRSTSRVFNSVKQAVDYDPKGEYVYHWIPEFQKDKSGRPTVLIDHENREDRKLFIDGQLRDEPCKVQAQDVFRGYTMYEEKLHRLGLNNAEWIVNPLVRIDYIAGKTIAKPGQRERWRTRQEEEKQEHLKNSGKQNSKNGNGKANHRDDHDDNDNNGGGGPGRGPGGNPPSSSSNGGTSGEGSTCGNGSWGQGSTGSNYYQRNQSNNQHGDSGNTSPSQHRQAQGHGRTNSKYQGNNARLEWRNNSQQHPHLHHPSNRHATGWVSNGYAGSHHRMILPPPGLPPRNFTPGEAAPNAFGHGPPGLRQWGHPGMGHGHGHGPPGLPLPGPPQPYPIEMNGMGLPMSPRGPPGLMSPDQARQGNLISPMSSMSLNGYHQGIPHQHAPHIPHQWPQYVMSANGYRNFGNGAHEGPLQYTGMPRTGYTPDNGLMDLSRTVRGARMDIERGRASGSWRQPSGVAIP